MCWSTQVRQQPMKTEMPRHALDCMSRAESILAAFHVHACANLPTRLTPPNSQTPTPGLSPHELSKLLTTAFGLGGHAAVLGFIDQQSVIVPISLACSSTQAQRGGAGVLLSPGGTYQLLLTHEMQAQQHSPVGVTPTSSSASPPVPTLPVCTPHPPAPDADRALSPHEEQWKEPLARFLHALAGQGVLTSEEHATLEPLVDEGHIALAAAYRVAAARGGNRELLAAMCKRVAQGAGQGQEGESLLEAQAEMLRMLGHVLEEGLVTPKQHTQLVRIRMMIMMCVCMYIHGLTTR